MTQPSVVFSPDAQDDLFGLQAYISSQSGQARAELIVERILETISTISYMPGMGSRRSFLDGGSLAFPVPPWLIIYRSLPELDGIQIIRVIDSRRDLKDTL